LPSAVEIHAQDGVDTVGFQPFLTLTDANAGFAKARIQDADGKLVFYTQSALNAGAPTVVFNSLAEPGGQPLPSAVEIHAQDGVNTVGYQPFLTLMDANASFANGDIVLYSQGGMNRAVPEMIVESASGDVHVTETMKVDKDVLLTGSGCAERFDLAEQEDLEAGTVVVIDLLTVSSTPGHAMKASDPARAFGALLGKALRPLRFGRGLIPILVALQ
jgi:hypothetical protein